MKDKLTDGRRKINRIDKKSARLFIKRMGAAEQIAEYKREHGLDVFDSKREAEVIEKNSSLVPLEYRRYYVDFLKKVMSLSKKRQKELIYETYSQRKADVDGLRTTLDLCVEDASYPIFVGEGLIESADRLFNLNRKAFIITDDGVPAEYSEAIRKRCKEAYVMTVAAGEKSKSISTLESALAEMSSLHMDRGDCVIAVGGGVVGDLAGFAAAVYMRGIDFYNVPTTLLSQVDSSIGGKTAINFNGIKNLIGAFNQPRAVIVDTTTLSTLPIRHMRNGLCEVIKMAATCDKTLFNKLESASESEIFNNATDVIIEALKIKKSVVEADEKEKGLRKILNFGHTLGHAIESSEKLDLLLHGECVAIGMIPVSSEEVRKRLVKLLEKFSLPTRYDNDVDSLLRFIAHDKKGDGDKISVIFCDKIGEFRIESITPNEFKTMLLSK